MDLLIVLQEDGANLAGNPSGHADELALHLGVDRGSTADSADVSAIGA